MLHDSVQGFTALNDIALDEGVPMTLRDVRTPALPSAKEQIVDRNIRLRKPPTTSFTVERPVQSAI